MTVGRCVAIATPVALAPFPLQCAVPQPAASLTRLEVRTGDLSTVPPARASRGGFLAIRPGAIASPGRYYRVHFGGDEAVKLYETIRAAGGGEIVAELAKDAGVGRDQAEQALRTLLPEFGRAIRRTGESRTGAPAVHAAMRDERYARYLDHPAALREGAAAADGERVLAEVIDEAQRNELIRAAAAAVQAEEAAVRRLLPLIATLAMAAIGERLRKESPQIPWFGTRPDDQFGAPLLDALAAMFEREDDSRSQRR